MNDELNIPKDDSIAHTGKDEGDGDGGDDHDHGGSQVSSCGMEESAREIKCPALDVVNRDEYEEL